MQDPYPTNYAGKPKLLQLNEITLFELKVSKGLAGTV